MRAWELTENKDGSAEVTKKIRSPEFKKLLTNSLIRLGNLYDANGFDLRIVGGAVRDLMLGNDPKDIDLASDATPEETMDMLKAAGIKIIETGLQHGTITAIIDGEDYEITTLRIDTETDGRHADVEFTKDWEVDAERRDLTFNAMSLELDGTLHDYFGGLEDLKKDKAKFVGDANKRMKEDYLRILRYFRFQGRTEKLNFDRQTLLDIERNAGGLKQISGERIWMEMGKILSGNHVIEILDKIVDTGVDLYIDLPSFDSSVLRKAKKNTDNPVALLAAMIQSDTQANKLASDWKLPVYDRELLRFIVNNRFNKFTIDEARDMWTNPKIKNDYVMEFSKFLGKTDIIQELKNWETPVFPVTGKDLMAAGIKPGPKMGNILKRLELDWKKSGYTSTWTKAELKDEIDESL